MEDKIVDAVISKFSERSDAGIKKYGTTLDRGDLSLTDWLTHLQEELMDATLYVQKLKTELESINESDFWESADKITHDGYVYVRYNDLIAKKLLKI